MMFQLISLVHVLLTVTFMFYFNLQHLDKLENGCFFKNFLLENIEQENI